MTDNAATNPWAAKARALDRYRWLLLRERHGVLGSALRFAREAAGDWLFGMRARRRLASAITPEACDFLLLQSAPKVIKFQRKKLLIEGLRARGHVLVETALQEPKAILRQRLLTRPPCTVPTRYFGHAAYAEWLVAQYQPRVLLNDRNGSLYAPFLRLSLNRRDKLLVHLAHATTVEGSRRLGMNDYDYYVIFGKSSEQALFRRGLIFGSSTLVLAGSHMINDAFDIARASVEMKTLLVLGVGPDKEKEPIYQDAYRLVSDWAAGALDYRVLVKSHPRSAAPLWREAAGRAANISLLPADTSLDQALAKASVVINFMSNAVIEAGLARRPVIYVGLSPEVDIFDQVDFFGAAVTDVDSLRQRIQAIEHDYPCQVQVAEDFASFHLAGGFQGLERTIGVLEALVRGMGIPAGIDHSVLNGMVVKH